MLMMKRNRAQLNVGQHQIPPYERQRLERVRFNEERMKAKGFGSLANKSLLDKTQEILSGWRDDEIFSYDDEYFTSDYEGYDEENETNNDARQNTMEVEKEGVKHPLSQPLSMRDFVHKNGQRNQQAKANTQSENIEQNRRKSVGTAQPAKEQMTKDTARPQKQQPKGKTQEKEYCISGSISSFRLFRQKQLERMRHTIDIESPITDGMTHEANLEIQIPSTIIRNDEVEHELEQQPINEEIEVESQPNEIIEEACKSKKERGPTTLTMVHSRTREEREAIVLNSIGQPVGPTKEVVDEFSLFLGTVARDSELAPLNYRKFKLLPTLDKIWDYVLEKYMVPDQGKKWVFESINASWRGHKCRVKQKHYYAHETDEKRWENRPKTVSDSQFKDLLEYWNCSLIEKEAKINKGNRGSLDDMHTMGPKSYAMLRHKLQQEDSDKQEPSQEKVYKESRKRNPEKTYLTNNEKSISNIAKMDALQSVEHGEYGNTKDHYFEVIQDPVRKNRVRLYGRGVRKTDLKKKDKNSGFIFPQEFLQSMETQLVQKLGPIVASVILSQIQAANPGAELVIPDFSIGTKPNDASRDQHTTSDTNEQASNGPQLLDCEERLGEIPEDLGSNRAGQPLVN